MRQLCYLLLFLLFSPVCLSSEEELVVHLCTKEERSPLYLAFFTSKSSGFEENFLKSIESVLRFDLDHNGKTQVAALTPEKRALASQEKDLFHFNSEKWRNFGLDYVVKAHVENKKLSVSAFTLKNQKLKVLEGLPLTGNLSADRKIVHQVADAIFSALFQERGIASTKILYTLRLRQSNDSTKWISEVWQADYDGANAKQLTHENALCVTPSFISQENKGRDFVYVSYKIGQPKIFAGSSENGTSKRLTYLKGNQLMPVVSPLMDKVAFISDITGNPDLFVQDFSPDSGMIGKPRQIFAAPMAAQGSPTFSPDGKKIAFVSNKDGTARIYILEVPSIGVGLKDLKPILISKKNRDNTSPVWSPDGSRIAFSAMTKGVRQIWIYDLQTKQETQLTDGQGHKENPTWAPNSLHLMFNSSSYTNSELYLIHLKQKQAVKISSGPGEKRFPSWGPFSSVKEERNI